MREAVRRGGGKLALLKELRLLTPDGQRANHPDAVKKEMALRRQEREAKMA